MSNANTTTHEVNTLYVSNPATGSTWNADLSIIVPAAATCAIIANRARVRNVSFQMAWADFFTKQEQGKAYAKEVFSLIG